MDIWCQKNKVSKSIFCFLISCINLLFNFFNFFNLTMMNKSRQILAQDEFNSILPTLKTKEFNDSFKNLIFFVEKKLTIRYKIFFYKTTLII